MGDAAGQLAHRLHLLRLAQDGMGFLQLGGAGLDPLFQLLIGFAHTLQQPRIFDRDARLPRKAR